MSAVVFCATQSLVIRAFQKPGTSFCLLPKDTILKIGNESPVVEAPATSNISTMPNSNECKNFKVYKMEVNMNRYIFNYREKVSSGQRDLY